MNGLILKIVSKKVTINGEVFLQPPNEGLKKRIFDYCSKKQFQKEHRNLEAFEISELATILNKACELFQEKTILFRLT